MCELIKLNGILLSFDGKNVYVVEYYFVGDKLLVFFWVDVNGYFVEC